MSNEKKNPLIGAFRTPAAGAPPTPAPAEPSKEAKAPVIPTQPAKAAVSPTKPDEVKKPAELAKDDKAAKDGKPAAAPSAPVKPDESKKPTEPAKDDKAAKDGIFARMVYASRRITLRWAARWGASCFCGTTPATSRMK